MCPHICVSGQSDDQPYIKIHIKDQSYIKLTPDSAAHSLAVRRTNVTGTHFPLLIALNPYLIHPFTFVCDDYQRKNIFTFLHFLFYSSIQNVS